MINPTSVYRSPVPPKPTYIPSPPPGGYPKDAEAPNPTPKEVAEHEKKARAPPEETEEERKAKIEPVPVKMNPENEPGDLDPPKHDDDDLVHVNEDQVNAQGQRPIFFDKKNSLWRQMDVFVQLQ